MQVAQAGLPDWFATGLGQNLLQSEADLLPKLVPQSYYKFALQIGAPWLAVTQSLNVENCLYVCSKPSPSCDVLAVPEALPFGENCIDLLMMMHTLDYCQDPVAALREASQVISPEGVLVLTGFNPVSFWGVRRRLSLGKTPPYNARFLGLKQVQDWLSLLGFSPLGASMLDYKLPVQSEKMRKHMAFLDGAGDRWWPICGGVYVLVAKKQIYSKMAKTRAQSKRDWLKILNPVPAQIKKN